MPINVVKELVDATGLEIIRHPLFNQEHQANEMGENLNNMVIAAVPVSSWNPEHVEESKEKKRRRTPSSLDEEIEKDFSLLEVFKCNSIQEINLYKENGHTIDPQELLKNLKGWKIEIKTRGGSGGNKRKDQFYCHRKSKRKLRSLLEVRRFIEDHSYLRKDSDSDAGSKNDHYSEIRFHDLVNNSHVHKPLFNGDPMQNKL
ncbi:hypothetical protein L2E82_21075 [Cichorium intybus]|uniref:Uncharacterized protein n=1 Tax=Cichorium intybus TaxID=13427 RepID=A0ACB9DUW1_CICIN|nr:hypothetical protein L2E82_21075 [Cichorium intybus]